MHRTLLVLLALAILPLSPLPGAPPILAMQASPTIQSVVTGSSGWTFAVAWEPWAGATTYVSEPFLRHPVDSSLGRTFLSDTQRTFTVPYSVTTDSIVLQLWTEARNGGIHDYPIGTRNVFLRPPVGPSPAPVVATLSTRELAGRLVRAVRAWLDWTQGELADSASAYAALTGRPTISPSRVGSIERAQGSPVDQEELTILFNTMANAIAGQVPPHYLESIPLAIAAFLRQRGTL